MRAHSGVLTMFGDTPRQLFRYGIVGVGVNLLLYAGYLAATSAGMGHKTSMTVFYGVGVGLSFLLNRNWSFGDRRQVRAALPRYLLTYLAGYLLNLMMLWWLVDALGLPHPYVQAFLTLSIAVSIFIAQKFWVFSAP